MRSQGNNVVTKHYGTGGYSLATLNRSNIHAMMGGLAQAGSVDHALRLFARMCAEAHDDPIAVSSVLGACAQACTGEYNNDARAFRLGQSIHALIVRNGFGSDQRVGNSLIDMYAKCMQMDEAVKVFESLPNISIVSWNILITGYGQAGSFEKAMEVLNRICVSALGDALPLAVHS